MLPMPSGSQKSRFAAYRFAKLQLALIDIKLGCSDPALCKLKETRDMILKNLYLSDREKKALNGDQATKLTAVEAGRVSIAKMSNKAVLDAENDLQHRIESYSKKNNFYKQALRAAVEDMVNAGVFPRNESLSLGVNLNDAKSTDTAKDVVEQLVSVQSNRFNLQQDAIKVSTTYKNHMQRVIEIAFPGYGIAEEVVFNSMKELASDDRVKIIAKEESVKRLVEAAKKYPSYLSALSKEGLSLTSGYFDQQEVWLRYLDNGAEERHHFDMEISYDLHRSSLQLLEDLRTATQFFIEDHSKEFESMFQQWESVARKNESDFTFS